jgi:O-antigen/teichoic acid export membrane protein
MMAALAAEGNAATFTLDLAKDLFSSMTRKPPEVAAAQSDGSLTVAATASALTLRSRVLSGSMIMLVSSGIVGVTNFVYNLLIARTLGAVEFGHAAVVYTSLLLLSCFTLSFQMVCSKFVAQNHSMAGKAAIYARLRRRAWIVSTALAALIVVASGPLSDYLNLPSRSYMLLIGLASAFYVPLGVRRGLMQGLYQFRRLATNFVIEVMVKTFGAFLLLALGMGVLGVVIGMASSVIVAELIATPAAEIRIRPKFGLEPSFREGLHAAVFFIGQVLINNVDIVMVKHFFVGPESGLYAVVSLVGRIVFILCWSVVSSMFPISAGSRTNVRGGKVVLSTAVGLVFMVTSVSLLGIEIAPHGLWKTIFGAGFNLGGSNPYTSLLLLYAAATGVYSFSVVLMMYEMSRRIANTAWLQLATSGAVVVGIYLFHRNLHQVIVVQLVLMTALLAAVALPLLLRKTNPALSCFAGVRKLRRLTEDEVISEFLKNEFYEREYDGLRSKLLELVYSPDVEDPRENTLRRALLFRRRGRMWQELPRDTEWWEIELAADDLDRVRVFPRAHWLRLAHGSLYMPDIVERLQQLADDHDDRPFFRKIQILKEKLQRPVPETAVLLIGVSDESPLTVIEGNHRIAAALMVSPDLMASRFRFLCGFSPRMTQCCWYQTDLGSLWRYGRNRIRDLGRDRDAQLASMLEAPASSQDAA